MPVISVLILIVSFYFIKNNAHISRFQTTHDEGLLFYCCAGALRILLFIPFDKHQDTFHLLTMYVPDHSVFWL